MILVALLWSPLARAGETSTVTQACVDTGASASAVARVEMLSQKVEEADQDEQSGTQSARASVTRSWDWTTRLDLCPADDPMGGLLIPGDNLFEVKKKPDPNEVRTCVSVAEPKVDGTAEGAVSVDASRMHLTADGRVDVEVTAKNVSKLDTRWTAGSRFASRWRWTTPLVGAGTTTLTARIRIEASPGAAGSIEIPDLAKLTVWGGRIEGHVRRGATWEAVDATPPLDLVAQRVAVGAEGDICVFGDVSAVKSADRTTRSDGERAPEAIGVSGRLKETARIEVDIDAVERSDYPAFAKDGPVFNPCGCP